MLSRLPFAAGQETEPLVRSRCSACHVLCGGHTSRSVLSCRMYRCLLWQHAAALLLVYSVHYRLSPAYSLFSLRLGVPWNARDYSGVPCRGLRISSFACTLRRHAAQSSSGLGLILRDASPVRPGRPRLLNRIVGGDAGACARCSALLWAAGLPLFPGSTAAELCACVH